MTHLFDNGLVGLALAAVLAMFVGSVFVGIVACFRPKAAPLNPNFTYVATAITGLVLSVSSGVLGKPATVQVPNLPPTVQQSTPNRDVSFQANVSSNQIGEFQQLYAWTYVVSGLIALVIFISPTPANHDLVKNVALTTLGFLITLVGTLSSKVPSALAEASTRVLAILPRNTVLF
jgi:hypothetical protein